MIEVFIVPNDNVSVSSSAGGKIAVGSGLARLQLSDTDLALALSREFGRLAAAHHRESTSAGIAVSLVTSSPLVGAYVATSFLADLLFPMGSLFKVGISLLSSLGTEQIVEASQQDEADDFAAKLMVAAGFDLRALAEARPDEPEGGLKLGWLSGYFASRAKVAGVSPHLDSNAVAVQEKAGERSSEETPSVSGQDAGVPATPETASSARLEAAEPAMEEEPQERKTADTPVKKAQVKAKGPAKPIKKGKTARKPLPKQKKGT